jgi:RNA polymerase sigma factor (sigma-70 family)
MVDAYARRTLVREIGSWRRRRRVQQVLTDSLPEPRLSPTSSGAEDRLVLRAALLQLAAQQRAVVVLRFYSDLSEADIAQTLGICVGSVKRHASRGLWRLRQVLEPAEVEARKQR